MKTIVLGSTHFNHSRFWFLSLLVLVWLDFWWGGKKPATEVIFCEELLRASSVPGKSQSLAGSENRHTVKPIRKVGNISMVMYLRKGKTVESSPFVAGPGPFAGWPSRSCCRGPSWRHKQSHGPCQPLRWWLLLVTVFVRGTEKEKLLPLLLSLCLRCGKPGAAKCPLPSWHCQWWTSSGHF